MDTATRRVPLNSDKTEIIRHTAPPASDTADSTRFEGFVRAVRPAEAGGMAEPYRDG